MKEGDLILCTVEKVTNTITFVRLPNGQEGTIISSEIAPGRIKFMRQYVVPNKKIVCKVLRVAGENIDLSLRRVNSKEKKEVMQNFKQEQAILVAFKQILGEEAEKVKGKILGEYKDLLEFADEAKTNEKILTTYIPKEKVEGIRKVIDKKKKDQEMNQLIKIKCLEENGVEKIKDLFNLGDEKINITYISAGEFKLKLLVQDFKTGKKRMNEIIEELEKRAKKNKCEFFSTEEK